MNKILLLVIFFLLTFVYQYNKELKYSNEKIEELSWYKDRVKNYMLINLRQSEIIGRYKSSRLELEKDSLLHDMILKLD